MKSGWKKYFLLMTPIYNVVFTVEKIQVHTKIKEQHNQPWSTPHLYRPTISHLASPASSFRELRTDTAFCQAI